MNVSDEMLAAGVDAWRSIPSPHGITDDDLTRIYLAMEAASCRDDTPLPIQPDLIERLKEYARIFSDHVTLSEIVIEAATAITTLQAQLERMTEALTFYADPENYHAVMILGDRPCGLFAEDFSDDHGHEDYDRPMPGKRAREALAAPQGQKETT